MAKQNPTNLPTQLTLSRPTPVANQARTFVVRLVIDPQGTVRGAVSEPGSEDEWRSTFVSLDHLLTCLNERLSL